MESATILFRLFGASQVLLFLCLIISSNNPLRVRMIAVSFMSAAFLYFLSPLAVTYLGIEKPFLLAVIPSLTPSMLLLFVWVVFEENCPIPSWLIALVSVDVLLSVLEDYNIGVELKVAVASQVVKIMVAAITIYIVKRGAESDLVELRLKVRLLFISLLSITVLGVVILETLNVFSISLPETGEAIQYAWMFTLTLGCNYILIKLNPSMSLVGEPISSLSTKYIDSKDDKVIVSLLDKMQNDRLYADHDLRVGSLADMVGIPEYQLRKKINQSLGYRNFNQFVNRYRIEEAGERLLKEPRTPVLSIALDVGFRSISSFNTAFQAYFGVSATAYRTQTGTDS